MQGTNACFTEITLKNGKLGSTCTCPAGSDCEHGVAAVLEYLDLTEQEEEIPVAAEGEELIIRARVGPALKGGEGRDSNQVFRTELRKGLEQLEKEELIDLLMNESGRDPLFSRKLWDLLNPV